MIQVQHPAITHFFPTINDVFASSFDIIDVYLLVTAKSQVVKKKLFELSAM